MFSEASPPRKLLQEPGLNLTRTDVINITGHAWGQEGSVDRVEYRVGSGPWHEATYSDPPGELGALTPFLWHVILDPRELEEGQHIVEVHASSGDSHSLPVFYEVTGEGGGASSRGIPTAALGLVVLVAMGWAGSLVLARLRSPDGEEAAIDAELVD